MLKQKVFVRGYTFFGELTPIMGLYAVYFASRGVSSSTISLLFFIWSATIILFELPSSVYADLFSRKQMLVLSRLFKLVCMIIWIIFPNTLGFLVGFIAWGISTALNSGTFQAYVHDTMTSGKKQFKNELSFSYYAGLAGSILSFIIGFVILKLGGSYRDLLTVGVASLVISLTCSVLLKKDAKSNSVDESEAPLLKLHLEKVVSSLKNRKLLIAVLITGALLGALKGGLEEYHSLLLSGGGLSDASISLFFLLLSVSAMVGTYIVNRSTFRLSSNSLLIILVGGAMLFSPVVSPLVAVALLSAMNVIDSILRVNLEVGLHDMTESKVRASIASTSGALMEFGSLALFIISALLLSTANLSYIYYICGVSVVVLGIYFTAGIKQTD